MSDENKKKKHKLYSNKNVWRDQNKNVSFDRKRNFLDELSMIAGSFFFSPIVKFSFFMHQYIFSYRNTPHNFRKRFQNLPEISGHPTGIPFPVLRHNNTPSHPSTHTHIHTLHTPIPIIPLQIDFSRNSIFIKRCVFILMPSYACLTLRARVYCSTAHCSI